MGHIVSFEQVKREFRIEVSIFSKNQIRVRCKNAEIPERTISNSGMDSCLNAINQVFQDLNPSQVLNIDNACKYLDGITSKQSGGRCAAEIHKALVEGGLSITPPKHARNYHLFGWLSSVGFHQIKEPQQPMPGDIAVQTYEDYGHICMYTGSCWVSDFRQKTPRGKTGDAFFYRLPKTISVTLHNMNVDDQDCEECKRVLLSKLSQIRSGYHNTINIFVYLY